MINQISRMRILYVRGKGKDLSAQPILQKLQLQYYKFRLENLLSPYKVEMAILDGSAHITRWTPVLDTLNLESYDLLIGHSSGVHALLRQAEKRKLKNLLLTSATYQHHQNKSELKTGWFNSAWNWSRIKSNVKKIVICNGGQDKFIPLNDGVELSKRLTCTLIVEPIFGHSDWYTPYINVLGVYKKNLVLRKVVDSIFNI